MQSNGISEHWSTFWQLLKPIESKSQATETGSIDNGAWLFACIYRFLSLPLEIGTGTVFIIFCANKHKSAQKLLYARYQIKLFVKKQRGASAAFLPINQTHTRISFFFIEKMWEIPGQTFIRSPTHTNHMPCDKISYQCGHDMNITNQFPCAYRCVKRTHAVLFTPQSRLSCLVGPLIQPLYRKSHQVGGGGGGRW